MSVAKITFYLRACDRDRVIELLEQKSELMKEMIASHNSNDLDRFGQALEEVRSINSLIGSVLTNRSLNISYDPMPKVEEESWTSNLPAPVPSRWTISRKINDSSLSLGSTA